MSKKDEFVRTSVKHGIKAGDAVRFGILQDGDLFKYPDQQGTLYHKSLHTDVYSNLPPYNAINEDYRVETVADDTLIIAKSSYKQRDDFPAGQVIRFDELPNGDEFILNDTTYRKRTDWYDLVPHVDAFGVERKHLVKSSANAINEAVMYPNFKADDIVIFVEDETEDLSQYNWIFQTD